MLPAMHQAQHAEAEQRQVLEEAVEAAGPVQVVAVGERDFVIGDVVQLVVHVADGVEVNARGDERHHAEHDDGQRVDVVADRRSAACRTRPSVYHSPEYARLRRCRHARACGMRARARRRLVCGMCYAASCLVIGCHGADACASRSAERDDATSRTAEPRIAPVAT